MYFPGINPKEAISEIISIIFVSEYCKMLQDIAENCVEGAYDAWQPSSAMDLTIVSLVTLCG